MSNFENHVQKELVTDTVFTESNEEFVLPDYMPEIGRVLRVCSSILPDEPFFGTEGAELSGRIEYRLLYADGEGVVTEAPLEGHYRYRLAEREAHAPVLYTEEMLESAEGETALLLFNETYSGADDQRGFSLLCETVDRLCGAGHFGIYVTHFHEVMTTAYPVLSAEIDPTDENRRTYRIVQSKGTASSYAADILRKYRLDRESLRERREQHGC